MGKHELKKQTLCWRCQNACGDCPWSDGTFTPVKGWKARRTIIRVNELGEIVTSYLVQECPMFKDDTKKYKPSACIAPPVRKEHYNPTNKSAVRLALEALPRNELLYRITTLTKDADIAYMAFIEKKTSEEISFETGRSHDTLRKRIAVLVRQLTEATA